MKTILPSSEAYAEVLHLETDVEVENILRCHSQIYTLESENRAALPLQNHATA